MSEVISDKRALQEVSETSDVVRFGDGGSDQNTGCRG